MTAPTSGPFTAFPRGPGQTPDNLTGLPNRGARGLGIIGGAIDYKDIKIGPTVICTGTMTGSPNATGTATLYVAGSEDGVTWPDFLDPNSIDAAAEALKFSPGQSIQRRLVQRINCPVNNTQYTFDGFSIASVYGYIPSFVAIYITNVLNGAMNTDNTRFLAGFRLITFN